MQWGRGRGEGGLRGGLMQSGRGRGEVSHSGTGGVHWVSRQGKGGSAWAF